MPDHRKHRGPHPQDAALFAETHLVVLRQAVADLGWLLGRGYSDVASLSLVGDRFQLQQRQRRAIMRAASAPENARRRQQGRVPIEGARIAVDGFNVLVAVEAALSGGLLIRGMDGLLRDLSSVHGNYRKVEETGRALDLLVRVLEPAGEVLWVLDRPVSNSGRVAALLRERGFEARLAEQADAELVALCAEGAALGSADGPLLDRVERGVDLVGPVVQRIEDAWVVELG